MKRLTAAPAALVALAASAALAAPPVVIPGLLGPRSGGDPSLAQYPVEVVCPQTVHLEVSGYSVPKGWNTFGLPTVFKAVEISGTELHCQYTLAAHPEVLVTSLRLTIPKDACIIGPGRGVFRCKPGTPH